ncbi:MAG: hypothetical protein HKN93_11605, partial [Acidimicrobiia bacterium]|nr:hypothetical protein [Acidimicrobiia bacterium]
MRRIVPVVVVAVGVLAAVLSFWMNSLFRPAEFVDVGVQSLRSEASRDVIVDAVVDAIADEGSDARALLEPIATRALSALLDSQLVEGTLVAVAEDLYDSLLSDEPSDVVLLAQALVQPVADAVAVFNEDLAGDIRDIGARITLINGDSIPSFRRAVSV